MLKRHLRIAGRLLVLPWLAGIAGAATLTWTGGGGDNNIATAANWSPAQIPVAGDVLIFAGGTRVTPQLAANLAVASLTFNATAQAFVLGGAGAYTVNSGITNNSTNTQTIGNAISLGANQAWNAASGDLVFNGAVNLSNRTLTNSGGNTTTIAGVISGTGIIGQNGTGTLVLSGNNTYSGGTTVTNGTLVIGSNTALGTGTLSMDGGILSASGGARTIANNVDFNDRDFTFGGTENLTVTGSVLLGRNILATVSGTGLLSFDGVLDGNNRRIQKQGSGTMALNGANTFRGGVRLEAGTLILGNNSAAGTGTLTLNSGTLQAGGGAWTLSNAVVFGGDIAFGGANNLTFSGTASLGGSRTLTVTNPNTTFSGVVSGGGVVLTKAGAGTLTLSATNTYSGGTSIRNGTLVLDANAGAGTGTVTVGDTSGANTATLLLSTTSGRTVANALSVASGGTGLRTIGGLNTGGTNTFSGTLALGTGVALTAAAGGTVTFSGVVSGAGGVTKTGSGTVLVSNTNTFTGGTRIDAGTLVAGNNQAFGSAGRLVTFNGGSLASNADARSLANSIVVNAVAGNTITGSNSLTLTGAASSGGAGSTLIVDFTDATKGLTINPAAANSFAPGAIDIEGGSLILGASNRIADGTSLTMDGGTLNTQGFSDTLGAMILASDSTINFGATNTVRLQFSSASWTGGTLTLQNWTGVIGASNNADQFLVQGAVSQDFLSRVNFQGMGVGVGAVAFDRGGGLYEIVPVPEPSTLFGALAVLGVLGFRERRWIAKLARSGGK